MKIISDNNDIIQGRGTSLFKTNTIVKRPIGKHSFKSSASLNVSGSLRQSGSAHKRSITDALSISLAAQRIIQRAIEVSSRLQGMAQKAILTGKADFEEVIGAVARVRDVVQEMPDTEVASVAATSLDIVPVNPSGSNAGKSKYLAETVTKLREVESSVSANISSLGKQLEPLVSGSKIDSLSDETVTSLNRETAFQITNDPKSALKSQGNIDPGFVARINQS